MELKKALIYWQESTNGGQSRVYSHAFTMAGDRLLVVPSHLGVVDRENPLICREVAPEPNQAELVLLRESINTSGGVFYIAFPFDNKLIDLPGIKEYFPIPMNGVRDDLLRTHHFEDGKHVRIFKSHTKYPHANLKTQDTVSWAELGSIKEYETIKCRITYKMARDNRLVGNALPSLESYRSRLGLDRVEVLGGPFLTEKGGNYEMVIPNQESAQLLNVHFREICQSDWIVGRVRESGLVGLIRDKVYTGNYSGCIHRVFGQFRITRY